MRTGTSLDALLVSVSVLRGAMRVLLRMPRVGPVLEPMSPV